MCARARTRAHTHTHTPPPQVVRESRNKTARLAPYFAALPTLREARHTVSFEVFPLDYLHLIQSEMLVGGLGACLGVGWACACACVCVCVFMGVYPMPSTKAPQGGSFGAGARVRQAASCRGDDRVAPRPSPLLAPAPPPASPSQAQHIANTQLGTLTYWCARTPSTAGAPAAAHQGFADAPRG